MTGADIVGRMDPAESAPDVLVLSANRDIRAPLRAQLIEDGHNVVAADAWPVPRRFYRADAKPRAVVVDLRDLPDPQRVIDELAALARPEHSVIVMSLGSVAVDDLRRRGFHVVTRPTTVGEIAAIVGRLLQRE